MAKEVFYLGVEGGATKSTAFLVDENNNIVKKSKGKALNYHATGAAGFRKNFKELVSPLLKKSKGGRLYAVFGLAGLNNKQDEAFYKKEVSVILPGTSKYKLLNDANVGLEARCPNYENSVLVIAGTGASVYGVSGKKSAKAVGWEYILGDDGGGYQIGLSVARAAVRSWDGRAEKTMLEGLVLEKTESKNMEEFMYNFYKKALGDNHKHYIASFARLVDEAILKKDKEALKIRDHAAKELALGLSAVAHRLDIKNKEFCVGTIGSVWKMPGLLETFKREVKKEFKKAHFSTSNDSGAWGAVLLAKKLK